MAQKKIFYKNRTSLCKWQAVWLNITQSPGIQFSVSSSNNLQKLNAIYSKDDGSKKNQDVLKVWVSTKIKAGLQVLLLSERHCLQESIGGGGGKRIIEKKIPSLPKVNPHWTTKIHWDWKKEIKDWRAKKSVTFSVFKCILGCFLYGFWDEAMKWLFLLQRY